MIGLPGVDAKSMPYGTVNSNVSVFVSSCDTIIYVKKQFVKVY